MGALPGGGAGISATGNSRKNMMRSVDASLKRLGTDDIDLLWTHLPDGVTPMEEILRGFDDLVRSGKILYAGLSNFAAWRGAQDRAGGVIGVPFAGPADIIPPRCMPFPR